MGFGANGVNSSENLSSLLEEFTAGMALYTLHFSHNSLNLEYVNTFFYNSDRVCLCADRSCPAGNRLVNYRKIQDQARRMRTRS